MPDAQLRITVQPGTLLPQPIRSATTRPMLTSSGDGVVSLYDVSDAASSAAHYLAVYGWKPGISQAEKRQSIWHYNRSEAYIDTVLGLAARIEAPAKMPKPARARPATKQRVAADG